MTGRKTYMLLLTVFLLLGLISALVKIVSGTAHSDASQFFSLFTAGPLVAYVDQSAAQYMKTFDGTLWDVLLRTTFVLLILIGIYLPAFRRRSSSSVIKIASYAISMLCFCFWFLCGMLIVSAGI